MHFNPLPRIELIVALSLTNGTPPPPHTHTQMQVPSIFFITNDVFLTLSQTTYFRHFQIKGGPSDLVTKILQNTEKSS